MTKNNEPVLGVPYFVAENPHRSGLVPPNAVFSDPKGIPIHQTIFRDTPAPFNCVFCGDAGLTMVKSEPSLAAVVGCMIGFCFLLPSMDCLWHKYHPCPTCKQKVADFEKTDACAVMDPPHWKELSFALPA